MASVFDVAKYVLSVIKSTTTMKLQKLVYYSQAWSLAWTDMPLFDEEFEAWANGPVCRELYSKHKGQFVIDECSINVGDISALSEDQKHIIDSVLDFYKDKEALWLSNLSHMERPWRETRSLAKCTDGEYCDAIISKELMQEYYAGL